MNKLTHIGTALKQKKAPEANQSTRIVKHEPKTYRVLDLKNEKIVKIQADPHTELVKQKEPAGYFFAMLGTANREDMTRAQKIIMHEAMRQNAITADEAFKAFWLAYGDPYLKSGTIEFRNLMKYITEMRGAEKPLNYQQVCALVTKEGYDMNTDFEIINPESPGKKLWKRKTKT